MKGIVYACLAGAFLTLQGTANAAIGDRIGSWQAAALTQGTGFIAALLLVWLGRKASWRSLKEVKLPYLFGGAFAALILISNITAFHMNGAAVTVASVLFAQITVTLIMEKSGWFGRTVLRMGAPQWAGLGLMAVGIICLTF